MRAIPNVLPLRSIFPPGRPNDTPPPTNMGMIRVENATRIAIEVSDSVPLAASERAITDPCPHAAGLPSAARWPLSRMGGRVGSEYHC